MAAMTITASIYTSVRLGLLALFLELDLDTMVVMRTAPTQSWKNPVERVMSVLNLSLQGVALARQEMAEVYENDFKKCKGMSSVRKVAEAHDVGDVAHQQQQQQQEQPHQQQQQQQQHQQKAAPTPASSPTLALTTRSGALVSTSIGGGVSNRFAGGSTS
jgi:hypothetical protein